jgi:hypothetical protein
MNERELSSLCDRIVEQFGLSGTATYKDTCRRVGEVMSELLRAEVELKFITTRTTRISGATARRPDGSYIVYCAKSRSWYHRLGILLHELAHCLLGHQAVALTDDGVRRFAPHLPGKMIRLLARRTTHSQCEEQEAEELADRLLERLTEQRSPVAGQDPARMAPHIMRIAEGLSPQPGRRTRRRPDRDGPPPPP